MRLLKRCGILAADRFHPDAGNPRLGATDVHPQSREPMSDRRSRNARRPRSGAYDPRPAAPRAPARADLDLDDGPGLGLPEPLRGSVPAAALLPLRFFLGAMFVYAGLDKLMDPAFLSSSGPGSIAVQLQEFAKVSPLAPLVTVFAEPFPVLVGLGIALLEIAIGLGAIFGLLYRWSALAGAGLSVLFFLTASWTTRPYYLGPDLPYALAWVTLAAAGSGGVLTVDAWLARREAERAGQHPIWPGAARWEDPADPGRRAILQLGVLAALTVGLASVTRVFARSARVTAANDGSAAFAGSPGTALASPSPTDLGASAATTAPSATAGATAPADAAQGILLGNISQLPVGRAGRFRLKSSGDPAIIVHLDDGSVAAYDAVCTHAGCTVGYDRSSKLLVCPCHGAAFDPAAHAQVVGGPTDTPLTELPIKLDQATGRIYLEA